MPTSLKNSRPTSDSTSSSQCKHGHPTPPGLRKAERYRFLVLLAQMDDEQRCWLCCILNVMKREWHKQKAESRIIGDSAVK